MKDHGHKFSRNSPSIANAFIHTVCVQCISFSWNGCQCYLWSWQILWIAHTHTQSMLLPGDYSKMMMERFPQRCFFYDRRIKFAPFVISLSLSLIVVHLKEKEKTSKSLNQLCSQSVQPDFHSDYWCPTKRRKEQEPRKSQVTMNEWTNFSFHSQIH